MYACIFAEINAASSKNSEWSWKSTPFRNLTKDAWNLFQIHIYNNYIPKWQRNLATPSSCKQKRLYTFYMDMKASNM